MRAFPWLSVVPLATIFVAFWVGLGVFALLAAARGRPKTERIEKHGGSVLLSSFAGEYAVWFLSQPVKLCTKLRIHPDVLSWAGLLLTLAAVPALVLGHFGLGGWLFMLGAMLDSMDGTVARNLGIAGDSGEFLDAVLDRVADMSIFLGLLYYYRDRLGAAALIAVALCASTMISYMRAKAEAMNIDCPRVVLRRPERVVYLGCGMAMAPVLAAFLEPGAAHPVYHLTLVAVGLIAVLGTAGTVRTGINARRALRERDAAAREAAA
ncbi:MAG TPA: CDP-alcohol phosphatidyltransferase family protein [Polyangia bacterium]